MTVEKLIFVNSNQFGMGFKTLKLSVNGREVVDLFVRTQKNVSVVEIVVGSGTESPILKMEATITPLSILPSSREDKK